MVDEFDHADVAQPDAGAPAAARSRRRRRGDYGEVLDPDWAWTVVRERHPFDRSHVFTVASPHAATGAAPVVLLHGVGNSGAIFGPILSSLAPLGRVIAPTLSPPLLASAHPERHRATDDLIEWLTALAPPPWRLVGHSMGGVIAGLLMRSRPDVVSEIVLLNSPLPGVVERINAPNQLDRTGRALIALKALAQLTSFGRPSLPRFLRGPELLIVRNGLRGFVRDPGALDDRVISRAIMSTRTVDGAEFLRLARRLPDWHLAPFAEVPVTILLGDADPLVPPSDYDDVSAAYPGAAIHVADHCGHFVHLERSRLTVDTIADAFGATSGLAIPA